MGATSTVVVYLVAGGIVSVIGMAVSAFVFCVLVLPRVAERAPKSHLRFWTPWFFVSLSLKKDDHKKSAKKKSSKSLK